MRGADDPRHAVDYGAEVVLVTCKGTARMQAHADSQSAHVLPGIVLKNALHLRRRLSAINRRLEDGAHGITHGFEHRTAMAADDFGEQRVVASDDFIHRAPNSSQRRVLPSISVKRKVTVPLGSDKCGSSTSMVRHGRDGENPVHRKVPNQPMVGPQS